MHLPESAIQRPSVVCVKRALDGAIKDDHKAITASGIGAFLESVASFAKSWREDLAKEKKRQALELLAGARSSAEKKGTSAFRAL